MTSHSVHLYIVRYDQDKFANLPKTDFVDAMRKEGIPTSPGYSLPLYKQPVFLNKSFGPRGSKVDLPIDYSAVECPITERACYEEAIWFPQFVMLGAEKDMDDIVAAVKKISENANDLVQ
ncbi:MAG: DegT/DnrJ/EryC1/StrS family aminotransferase [candidate division KSB1 bacterium]|nr:DegT/DnrJ/EryC1/StrS family aminotransferase [candidate division KSB1 bacterium]